MQQQMMSLAFALLLFTCTRGSITSSTGNMNCKCARVPATADGKKVEEYDCNQTYASSAGKCVNASVKGKYVDYPGDYGKTCQAWPEPGHPSCYDVCRGEELPKQASASSRRLAKDDCPENNNTKKAWCDDPWCYVDPCACEAKDKSVSLYFTQMVYSYMTCGSSDKYTSEETDGGKTAQCANEVSASFFQAPSMVVMLLAAAAPLTLHEFIAKRT